MSFIKSMVTRGGGEAQNDSEGFSCMRLSARMTGVIGGFVAVITGIWLALSIVTGDWRSFAVAIWQGISGFICIVAEATFCCPQLSKYVDKTPDWAKALGYVILGATPLFFNFFTLGVWLGSGSIFATGVLYGFLTIGKRATLEQMQARLGGKPTSTAPDDSLVNNAAPIDRTTPETLP